MDTRGIEEKFGDFVLDEKNLKLADLLREKLEPQSKVIIICHEEDEMKCRAVAKAANLEVSTVKYEEYRLLPKGKAVIAADTGNGDDISGAIDFMVETYRQEMKRDMERSLEKLGETIQKVDYDREDDREQRQWEREQMRFRSRQLSKCKNLKK